MRRLGSCGVDYLGNGASAVFVAASRQFPRRRSRFAIGSGTWMVVLARRLLTYIVGVQETVEK